MVRIKMKDIAIFGGGGLGRETACLIDKINSVEKKWNIIGYFDDGIKQGTQIDHHGYVLGDIQILNEYPKELDVAIAIGNPLTVQVIVEKITNKNIDFPNIICPTFDIVDIKTFTMGRGNIIKNLCRASCNVHLGDFNMLNGMVVFGHDAHVGSFNSFMPMTRISGEVKIGNLNFFGIGSIVLQGIEIGNKIRLGAASVLMKSPQDGYLYVGNPARKMIL